MGSTRYISDQKGDSGGTRSAMNQRMVRVDICSKTRDPQRNCDTVTIGEPFFFGHDHITPLVFVTTLRGHKVLC